MKKIICLILGLMLFEISAYASTSQPSVPITVSASVPGGLTLEITIIDQLNDTQVPTMDFGELVRIDSEFRANRFFKVRLRVNAAGDAAELTQNGSTLTRVGGDEAIPVGAYMMKPEYNLDENSNQEQPLGSQIGSRDSAVGEKMIFRDPTGSSRTLSTIYTLSGDPNTGATEIISSGQKSGNYSGVIYYTLTTS